MYCEKCGEKISKDADYCYACGAKLSVEVSKTESSKNDPGTIFIQHSRDTAKEVVKKSFENTKGIKSYTDQRNQIISKTGWGLTSFGEKITVNIPIVQDEEDTTEIHINAEREYDWNTGANPKKYKERLVKEIQNISNLSEEEIKSLNTDSEVGEVETVEELPDYTDYPWVIALMTLIITSTFYISWYIALN